jgi:hypothetical protein
MAVERCALVLNSIVINVIVADPTVYITSDDEILVPSITAGPGYGYSGGVFTPPITTFQTQALTFYQFIQLFTAAEFSAIIASANAQVKVFIMTYIAQVTANLTDTNIVNAINYLVTEGIITSARAATILTGAPS